MKFSFKLSKLLAWGALTVSVALGAAAHAQTPIAPTGSAESSVSLVDGYVLGPGDVIEVSVLGREEYKPRVQVQVDGTIQLPFLNSLQAQNLTVLQLREIVRQRLKDGGYYAEPVVAVNVSTYASRYVIVLGEVGTPGLLPIDRAYRVSEILARVGGARATGSDEMLIRRSTGEEIKLKITQVATGGADQDPIVNPGDKIYVPTALTFYIYGQVNAPGNHKVDSDMTLHKALARGGGLTSLGSAGRVKVLRDGVELKKFKLLDEIKGGDVIVVGERFF